MWAIVSVKILVEKQADFYAKLASLETVVRVEYATIVYWLNSSSFLSNSWILELKMRLQGAGQRDWSYSYFY